MHRLFEFVSTEHCVCGGGGGGGELWNADQSAANTLTCFQGYPVIIQVQYFAIVGCCRFPEYRRALSSRDSILSNSSCVSKDSNEVDGPSSRKPSTTSRFLPGSTGGSSGGSSLRPSVVGAFLLTTLRIDVESDG